MIDHETLIWTLLGQILPTGTFYSLETNIAADAEIKLPAVIYSIINDGQTGNGPRLWNGQLDVNVLGTPDAAWTLASGLYDSIHVLADTQTGVVDAVGHIQELTDISAFSRPSTTQTVGKGVIQYAGSFALALRTKSSFA